MVHRRFYFSACKPAARAVCFRTDKNITVKTVLVQYYLRFPLDPVLPPSPSRPADKSIRFAVIVNFAVPVFAVSAYSSRSIVCGFISWTRARIPRVRKSYGSATRRGSHPPESSSSSSAWRRKTAAKTDRRARAGSRLSFLSRSLPIESPTNVR